MKFKNLIMLILILCLSSIAGYAQQDNSIEMADMMRSNGKIYVVVSSLLIIFFILAIYLIKIDLKITKKINNKQTNENNA